MHQKNKTKSYTIEYLREKFNCTDTYPVISEFKRNVLDKAIKDIEKHTPLRITYTQVKKGRVVTDIVFAFENLDDVDKKVKNKKSEQIEFNLEDDCTTSNIKLLSPKQADFFANKLAENQNFGGKFAKAGEDMKPFVGRISNELQRDISQVAIYMPYLLDLGFKQADN